MINKRLEDLREVMRREHLAVGTGTCVVTGTGAWVYPDACPRDYYLTT